MNKFNSCVAVITGAGSGIGRQLSNQLAQAGARLALSDINQENLTETVKQAESQGAQVFSEILDVADQEAFFNHADNVMQRYGEVHLVINNAGVGLAGGPLWQTPLEDFKWLMGINFYGVLYGTKAFLPHLRAAHWGHIVNISSLFGLVAVPEQTAYNASKFAVRGMTEALRQELELDGSSVSCTSVHPGGIKTNIAAGARVSDGNKLESESEREQAVAHFDKLARTSAETAAEQILDAVIKNKKRLLIGGDAKILDKIQRLFPTWYPHVMQRMMDLFSR